MSSSSDLVAIYFLLFAAFAVPLIVVLLIRALSREEGQGDDREKE